MLKGLGVSFTVRMALQLIFGANAKTHSKNERTRQFPRVTDEKGFTTRRPRFQRIETFTGQRLRPTYRGTEKYFSVPCQRTDSKVVSPINHLSTPWAALRPSEMAHTIKD